MPKSPVSNAWGARGAGTSAALPAGHHAKSSTPPPECISSAQQYIPYSVSRGLRGGASPSSSSILMCYYDKATTPDQWDLFSELAIHKNPTKLRGHFQVLKLDFSEAATGSVEDMNALLTEHINRQC